MRHIFLGKFEVGTEGDVVFVRIEDGIQPTIKWYLPAKVAIDVGVELVRHASQAKRCRST